MRINNIEDLIAILFEAKPSAVFTEMLNDGTLREDIPELATLVGAKQNRRYHLEDVWEHTMMCIDLAANVRQQCEYPEAFMLGTLLHDIGKPATCSERVVQKTGEVVINNIDHNKAGVPIAREILDRLGCRDDLKQAVIDFVLNHDAVYEICRLVDHDRDQAKRRLRSILALDAFADYILFNQKVDSVGVVPGPMSGGYNGIVKFEELCSDLIFRR